MDAQRSLITDSVAERHHTTCPLDCPDLCALEATVSEGRLVQLDGRSDDPITQGFICGKVRHFGEHVYGADRLLTPAVRVGRKGEGRFEPVSWDRAFQLIAQRIQAARGTWGGESILPFCYGGSNGKLTHDAFDTRFFRRIGALQLARTVCAAPTGRIAAEMYGKMQGVAYDDYVHAQLIVLWGANPQVSGIHLIPFVREAQSRGAKLVVVDPRTTPLARQADLHLPLRPGTDVAVALSVIHWLFEQGYADTEFLSQHTTGVESLRERAAEWSLTRAAEVADVPRERLEQFAEWYRAANPAVIRCGWGLERTKSAGSNVAAVLALPAVAGKFGVRGGGYTLSNSGAWKFHPDAANAVAPPRTRVVNMNHLGRELTGRPMPPIQVLFVYNCNPLTTLPNQQLVRAGLEREDLFTIVFDQVMTDTARYADLVLPATTFLEHDDYRAGYGYAEFRHLRPVIDRVGESRPNHEVFAELCRRLEIDQPNDPVSPAEWLRAFVGETGDGPRILNDLAEKQSAQLPTGLGPIQFREIFPGTADRKVHLFPEALEREAPDGLYRYLPGHRNADFPLQMISPATEHRINSTLGQLQRGIAAIELHPEDAAAREISTGDRIRAFNALGEVVCLAEISRETRRGMVVLPKGIWAHNTYNGQTSNALAPDELTDLAGGACFNDTWVQIEKLTA